jgi:membrane protein YqaA with SNARE-associated domain
MSQLPIIAAVVFGVNVLPALGPPTWTVLAYFRITDGRPIWVLVVVGAVAAAAGRYVLAVGFRGFGSHFPGRRRESLEALGATLSGTRGTLAAVVLFIVSPVPSNTLFEAAGLTRVRLAPLLAAFCAGRLVSYSNSLVSVSAAQGKVRDLIASGVNSPQAILIGVLGLLGLVALVRIDWINVIDRMRARRARRTGKPTPPSIGEQLRLDAVAQQKRGDSAGPSPAGRRK